MASAKKKDDHAKVTAMGGNIKGLFDKIAEVRDYIVQKKKERAQINADIKAAMEKIESLGIKKDGFRMALSYFESSTDQRKDLDKSYLLAREGMGLKVQGAQLDLLDGTEQPAAGAAPASGDSSEGQDDGQ
ncbi:MAG: hypothetical protein E6Q97_34200 [Desulfurellales bacterium]|nr:MAG: hypothetical protein E6Q97_34200 [Desulfurellales bacterium]